MNNPEVKDMIPLNENMCALIPQKDNPYRDKYFDAISAGWNVFLASSTPFADRMNYYVVDEKGDGGFAENIIIVPNYKCEKCMNRMIPSIQKRTEDFEIHYRCPMCCNKCNFDFRQPTLRLKNDESI